jgi:exonuclease SbcC
MNLFTSPRWKNKKPEIRIEALNELSREERDGVLADVASNDSDATVRQAAIKRLTDLDLLDALCADADAGICRIAETRLRQLLCGTADVEIAVEHRQRSVRRSKNAALLDTVIFNANDDNLKRHAFNAALALSNGAGLLQKVATQSDSAELRLYAVEKIDQGSTLKQIIDPLKKIDKVASRLAQTKLDQIQLAAGDAATMQRHQLRLCEKIELLNNDIPTPEKIAALQRQWDALIRISPSSACTDSTQRFARGMRIAERIMNPPAPPAEKIEPAPVVEHLEPASVGQEVSGEEAVESPIANEASIEQATALASAMQRCEQLLNNPQSKSSFKQLTSANKILADAVAAINNDEANESARVLSSIVKDRLDSLNKERTTAVANAKEQVGALQEHITNNAAGPARDAHRGLVAALKTARGFSPGKDISAISDQLGLLDPDYHKLTEAQHWSTTRVRKELVEKAEKLVGATLAPDELAKLVKGIQAEWKKLDEMEHDQGPNALRGRFSSACRKAWEPCAAYFAKMDEQRRGDLTVVDQFIQQLQGLDPDDMPINALLDKIELGGKVDRELRSFPAKLRGDWAKKLRSALKPLEKSRDRLWSTNAAAKQQLIDDAKELVAIEDLRRATDQMKRLQADWKKTGPTKRKQNNLLWDQFRGAGDAIFARAKQANNERRADQDKHAEFVKQQIDKVLELLEDTSAAKQLKQKLGNVQRDTSDALNEARKHPAAKAFSDAVSKVNTLLAQRQREEKLGALDPLREAAKAKTESASDDSAARDAVLLMEIAAGIDSPSGDSSRRMALQLDRLSSSFGRNAVNDTSTLLKMAESWYKEHSAPADPWAELDLRVQAVAKAS